MKKDLFNLSQKENLFLAKKHFSSLVYCGLKMENRNVTFPQTELILKNINVGSVSMTDIYAIIGLKRAFKYFLDNVEKINLSLDVMKKFNFYIAEDEAIESGVLRYGSVSISGTDYVPPIPKEEDCVENINKIINNENQSITERAIKLFLHLIYKQYFWDGNKRTALLSSNYLLVKNGKGLLDIKEKNMEEFAILLNRFFNTGKNEELETFLYEKCIDGISFF